MTFPLLLKQKDVSLQEAANNGPQRIPISPISVLADLALRFLYRQNKLFMPCTFGY